MNNQTVLITGVTGSFGKRLLKTLLADPKVKRIVGFSRDELKQFLLQNELGKQEKIHWVLGDVRDKDSLSRACRGVDIIIHAAALKQVVACEFNPLEAIKTNVLGAANLIQAAIENGVSKVIALSTDKAVSPVNLYGATKLCAEKLISAADQLNTTAPRLATVRWGNVIGSRGSAIPFFLKMRSKGFIPITDTRMTRFWITLEEAIAFILKVIEFAKGGEVFVPKVSSMKLTDMAKALAPEAEIRVIGIRPGEKLHEVLITKDEARHCLEFDKGYIIYSELNEKPSYSGLSVKDVPDDWEYNSGTNQDWLQADGLLKKISSTAIEVD